MRKHAARPFTLIEMIAVMGVMILLAAVAIPAYSSLFSGRKITLAANQLNGAIMEARAHAVSAKTYTALVFVKDGTGYKSFRMADVYYDERPSTTNPYMWRRWVSGTSVAYLPDNTMIPLTTKGLGRTKDSESTTISAAAPKVYMPKNVIDDEGFPENRPPAIVFKPNGQLAGTANQNMVVLFVESSRYDANSNKTPKLPLNINWLTCKTKFLDPVQK